jgi:hypothetical protein
VSRLAPEDLLLAEVKEIALPPLVEAIEEHFAGYFNEFGITLRLSEQAPDEIIVELRNKVLTRMEAASEQLKIDFTWQVSMYRGQTQVVLLFPGDSAIPPGGELALIYKVYPSSQRVQEQ